MAEISAEAVIRIDKVVRGKRIWKTMLEKVGLLAQIW